MKQFYNVHSHVFTMLNAPEDFLHLYLPGFAANAIDAATNTTAGVKVFSWALSALGGNWGKRYASFLSIGKSKSQAQVFKDLLDNYPDRNNLKFVALTMYMEQCGAGPSASGYEGQLEEIIKVKQEYPDNLLIFLGIDPRWKTSGTELRVTVERFFERKLQAGAGQTVYPFVGLKLYPSMGFYGFDEKLKETFEWAAENEVPVLSHCNYLGGIFNNDTAYIKSILNSYDVYANKFYSDTLEQGETAPFYHNNKNFLKALLGTLKNDANLKTCSYFLEPASYRTMLRYFSKLPKPLKLNLAHFGGSDHILEASGNAKPDRPLFGVRQVNWCEQIIELMTEFPGVYTDISYAVSKPAIYAPIIQQLNNPGYGDRILFGTDFFLAERELSEGKIYQQFKEFALKTPLADGSSSWEKIAARNTERFLRSKYYS